jgi:hypothetical protein
VKRVSDHRREMKVSGKIHMVKRMVKRKRRRGRGGEGEENLTSLGPLTGAGG